MKLGQLLAIFGLLLNLASFSAWVGFLAYLSYIIFTFNLTEQALILTGLLVAFKLFGVFGSAIFKTLKEGKWFDKEENEE
tara:strand:+ start:22700 stop:22939 length:240 start_codon:yes stop_codon:yes gene_type:complete